MNHRIAKSGPEHGLEHVLEHSPESAQAEGRQPASLLHRAGRILAVAAALVVIVLAFLGATSLGLLTHRSGRATGASSPAQSSPASQDQSWTTYAGNNARQGNNPASSSLTVNTAASLKPLWTLTGGLVSVQPIVANGMVYWGGWDGYERAATLDGNPVWSANLGVPKTAGCNMSPVGVANTAAVATINGRSLVFVGGGTATFYALYADTGQVKWQVSLGVAPQTFIWASPAVYNGSVYISTASLGDCPLVQGKLFRLDAETGVVQSVFDAVPNGCVGASMWGSPAIDDATGTIYVATGNPGSCSRREVYAEAIVGLRASDLKVLGSWQVPRRDTINDGDFGATPTLFTAGRRQLIGVGNKNGIYYVLDRQHLSRGPVWKDRMATGNLLGVSSFTGPHLFVGTAAARVGHQSCQGSLQALNPVNGHTQWVDCLDGGLFGPIMAASASGIVAVSMGAHLYVMSSVDGHILYSYDAGAHFAGADFYSGPAIVNGRIYVGDTLGHLYCFG